MSSFSFDLMSHSRHESGEISSATMIRIIFVFEQAPAFHLEVDQTDADAEKQPGEEVVDADGERHDVVDFLRRGPAERGDVLFRHHGVVELVVLVIELDDRARQLGALLDAEALRQRARRDVPHHHLQRHDFDLANQLLAHVEAADEMGRHPDVVEVLKQVLRNPVVEDALALDHLVFLGIERGRIILEVLDQGSRLRTFIQDLGLAFVIRRRRLIGMYRVLLKSMKLVCSG